MSGGSDLTLQPFLWRAEHLYPDREIVSRTHEGIYRYTYSEYADRVRQLAGALESIGVTEGDRVATFGWNNHWHHEAYFGVPCMGAELHMINILLPESHIQHQVEEAADTVLLVDPTVLDELENAYDEESFASVEQFVVFGDTVPDTALSPVTNYESFIADGSADYEFPDVSEDQPAGICYTSGTTGMPKGVEYTHKMYWAHTMSLLSGELGLKNVDVELTIVPMFHVSGWGRPFATVATGAKTVLPGAAPDPDDIAALIENEGVTKSAAVPTVWMDLLEYASENDIDVSSVEYVISGGSPTPKDLIEGFREQLDLEVVSGYGLTETTPVTHTAALKPGMSDLSTDDRIDVRAHTGLIRPGLEMKAIDDDGEEVPWDGESFGELHLRGPWVTTEYFNAPEKTEEKITDEGWLQTGDIVNINEEGYIDVVDRVEDLVKSGGEWISSIEVENHMMDHDQVQEAAVVAVPHERWDERPVAFVVSDTVSDQETLTEELLGMVTDEYPEWWAPDLIEFIDEIPKGSTGKFSKDTLREEYVDDELAERAQENAPGER
jgi:fatty-acyl-CoA synthase